MSDAQLEARMDPGPPWRAGNAQRMCATCALVVVATTLDAVGDCADCAHKARWDWGRQQQQLDLRSAA